MRKKSKEYIDRELVDKGNIKMKKISNKRLLEKLPMKKYVQVWCGSRMVKKEDQWPHQEPMAKNGEFNVEYTRLMKEIIGHVMNTWQRAFKRGGISTLLKLVCIPPPFS